MFRRKNSEAVSSTRHIARYSAVTSKGQTTIPAEIRRALNINPGDRVSFSIDNGRVVLEKIIVVDQVWNSGQSEMLSEWNDPEQDIYNR